MASEAYARAEDGGVARHNDCQRLETEARPVQLHQAARIRVGYAISHPRSLLSQQSVKHFRQRALVMGPAEYRLARDELTGK